MARERKLTWDKSTKRWCKCYKGRKLYLGYGRGKSDEQSYQLALDEFERRRAEIDEQAEASKPHRAEYQQAILLRREMVDWLTAERARWPAHDAEAEAEMATWGSDDADELWEGSASEEQRTAVAQCLAARSRQFGVEESIAGRIPTCEHQLKCLTRELQRLNLDAARARPPALDQPGGLQIDPTAFMQDWEKGRWEIRCEAIRAHRRWTGNTDPAATIDAQLDKFLVRKQAEARAGKVRPTCPTTLRHRLAHFRAFAGAISTNEFSGKQLSAFYDELLGKIESKELRPWTAKSVLSAVKRFVTWMYDEEVIECLPRKMERLSIEITKSQVVTLPLDHVKTLLAGARGRTKLYLLLMLNCGMYQGDISDLQPSEVNWTTGRITRQRSKTKGGTNVLTVSYKLWPETFALLQQCRSASGNRALTNRDGGALRDTGFKDDDGHTRNNDAVKSAYFRLCKRLKVPARPLKLLRKTSASLLSNEPRFRSLHQLFLGHAPSSVAEIHYVATDKNILDEALAWLGERYSVIPTAQAVAGVPRLAISGSPIGRGA